jgi:ureidoglycolate lyase
MREVSIQELTQESFKKYGSFENMINPKTEKFGTPPCEFYRDMLQQNLGENSQVSFSVCRVENVPLEIETVEYHSFTAEGIFPIDNDVLIHLAPASPEDGTVPAEELEVFRVPKGTMVVLRPGVWHYAPFITDGDCANVIIILPERTYANDCEVYTLSEKVKIKV